MDPVNNDQPNQSPAFILKQNAASIVGILRAWNGQPGLALHVGVRAPDGSVLPTSRFVWIGKRALLDLAAHLVAVSEQLGVGGE